MKLIGIAGPSCSGKTTAAEILKEKLNAETISQDEFYIKGSEKIYITFKGKEYRTFERPELYDGNRLADVLEELDKKGEIRFESLNLENGIVKERYIQKPAYLIIEGFLLFTYPRLQEIIDHKFYLDLNPGKIMQRRKERGGRVQSDEEFAVIGTREYEKHGLHQKYASNIYVIDADKEIEKVCDEILKNV